MAKPYSSMDPAEQREVDERDLRIMQLIDMGHCHMDIAAAVGVSASLVGRIKKMMRDEF